MSTATLTLRPSKEERLLKAAARRVSIQMVQLKGGVACKASVTARCGDFEAQQGVFVQYDPSEL